jgi:hypothetical protein
MVFGEDDWDWEGGRVGSKGRSVRCMWRGLGGLGMICRRRPLVSAMIVRRKTFYNSTHFEGSNDSHSGSLLSSAAGTFV